MQGSLAPHVLSLEVLAPLPHLDASPLLALPACARLHSLTLHHVRAAALPALAGLTRLQRLDATGQEGSSVTVPSTNHAQRPQTCQCNSQLLTRAPLPFCSRLCSVLPRRCAGLVGLGLRPALPAGAAPGGGHDPPAA